MILLATLSAISFATGDARAGTVMAVMVALSVALRFVQEARADAAAAKLKAMIHVTATVVRDGAAKEMPLRDLVPGDVVKLAAGDMIPGDVRLSPRTSSSSKGASPASRSRSRSSMTADGQGTTVLADRAEKYTASWAPASRAARPRRSSLPPEEHLPRQHGRASLRTDRVPTSFDQGHQSLSPG